jgi:site-specific recombinase XerD
MPSSESPNIARFGPFLLDLKAGELHKNGRKIRLQEQPFQVLSVLVQHPGELVTTSVGSKRHSPGSGAYAVHLLEAGTDIRKIQLLLGHRSLSTTARYLRLATTTVCATTSPLDLLPLPIVDPKS